MVYAGGMETPELSPGYPSKNRPIWGVWTEVYAILHKAKDPMDIQSLTNVVHAITPDSTRETVRWMINEAVRHGLADRFPHQVNGRPRSAVKLKDAYK